MNDERIAVIDRCLDCSHFYDWHCTFEGREVYVGDGLSILADCPLPRREPWLKLREAGAKARDILAKSGPDFPLTKHETDAHALLDAALEAVKEK